MKRTHLPSSEKFEWPAELGPPDNLADRDDWTDYVTKLLVPYQLPMDPKKFRRPDQMIGLRTVCDDVTQRAGAALLSKGAVLPITFHEDDWRVFEWRDHGIIEVIIHRKIAGVSHWIRGGIYKLAPDQIGWLKSTGRWRPIVRH